MKIAILGCGKQKVGGTDKVSVRHLYTSALFQKSLALAEATSDLVYVASAQHHLVTLDEEHAPYDQSLKGYGKTDREAWGMRVAAFAVDRSKLYQDYPKHSITIYAGEEYAEPIRQGLRIKYPALIVYTPMRGLMVGDRLKWLNDRLAEIARPLADHAVDCSYRICEGECDCNYEGGEQ